MRTLLAARSLRRISFALLTALAGGTLLSDGCLASDIAKRFREAAGDDFSAGLAAIFQNPDQPAEGLAQMASSLAAGLGAAIQPRTPSSTGSSN